MNTLIDDAREHAESLTESNDPVRQKLARLIRTLCAEIERKEGWSPSIKYTKYKLSWEKENERV